MTNIRFPLKLPTSGHPNPYTIDFDFLPNPLISWNNLNADQSVLKENFRAILQKNGLSDLVTPKIIKAMLEAFALGKSVNESSDEKAKLKAIIDKQKANEIFNK